MYFEFEMFVLVKLLRKKIINICLNVLYFEYLKKLYLLNLF